MFVKEPKELSTGLSSYILGDISSRSFRNPWPELWQAADTAWFIRVEMLSSKCPALGTAPNMKCRIWDDLVYWTKDHDSDLFVPVLRDAHVPFPIIHFHNAYCKNIIPHAAFIKHYAYLLLHRRYPCFQVTTL